MTEESLRILFQTVAETSGAEAAAKAVANVVASLKQEEAAARAAAAAEKSLDAARSGTPGKLGPAGNLAEEQERVRVATTNARGAIEKTGHASAAAAQGIYALHNSTQAASQAMQGHFAPALNNALYAISDFASAGVGASTLAIGALVTASAAAGLGIGKLADDFLFGERNAAIFNDTTRRMAHDLDLVGRTGEAISPKLRANLEEDRKAAKGLSMELYQDSLALSTYFSSAAYSERAWNKALETASRTAKIQDEARESTFKLKHEQVESAEAIHKITDRQALLANRNLDLQELEKAHAAEYERGYNQIGANQERRNQLQAEAVKANEELQQSEAELLAAAKEKQQTEQHFAYIKESLKGRYSAAAQEEVSDAREAAEAADTAEAQKRAAFEHTREAARKATQDYNSFRQDSLDKDQAIYDQLQADEDKYWKQRDTRNNQYLQELQKLNAEAAKAISDAKGKIAEDHQKAEAKAIKDGQQTVQDNEESIRRARDATAGPRRGERRSAADTLGRRATDDFFAGRGPSSPVASADKAIPSAEQIAKNAEAGNAKLGELLTTAAQTGQMSKELLGQIIATQKQIQADIQTLKSQQANSASRSTR